MKYLAILGRIPELSVAELTALFGDSVRKIGRELAVFEAPERGSIGAPNIDRLGGVLKLGYLLDDTTLDYLRNLPGGKITLGVSDYSRGASAHSAGREAMKLKKILVRHGRNVRVLANKDAALSTATCHHNQLGKKAKHVELLIVGSETYLSIGTQNITAYARRDQTRPARDAYVGMLPPKLAQILINLCGDLPSESRILDPFCGSGVVLQEALIMGYRAYGTDLSEKMVEYSQRNLKWLTKAFDKALSQKMSACPFEIFQGDATSVEWKEPIDAVACETYLGPPMSNPPSEVKLKAVKQECREIILGFLKNISGQLESGTPLCLATPAWLRPDGGYSSLNILDEIEGLRYNVEKHNNLGSSLLYHREGQIVAREIIVLRKK